MINRFAVEAAPQVFILHPHPARVRMELLIRDPFSPMVKEIPVRSQGVNINIVHCRRDLGSWDGDVQGGDGDRVTDEESGLVAGVSIIQVITVYSDKFSNAS